MDDVIYQKQKVYGDDRGFFLEWLRSENLENKAFVQANHSYSKKDVLRGMHFQMGQAKYVYVVLGEVYDVVVNLKTGEHKHFLLTGKGHETLFIPDGYAHGFYVLSDEAHVIYQVSTYYDPKKEMGFRYDDPVVNIKWPTSHPILSDRDLMAPSYSEIKSVLLEQV